MTALERIEEIKENLTFNPITWKDPLVDRAFDIDKEQRQFLLRAFDVMREEAVFLHGYTGTITQHCRWGEEKLNCINEQFEKRMSQGEGK